MPGNYYRNQFYKRKENKHHRQNLQVDLMNRKGSFVNRKINFLLNFFNEPKLFQTCKKQNPLIHIFVNQGISYLMENYPRYAFNSLFLEFCRSVLIAFSLI